MAKHAKKQSKKSKQAVPKVSKAKKTTPKKSTQKNQTKNVEKVKPQKVQVYSSSEEEDSNVEVDKQFSDESIDSDQVDGSFGSDHIDHDASAVSNNPQDSPSEEDDQDAFGEVSAPPKAVNTQTKSYESNEPASSRTFVTNLPQNVTQESLSEFFESHSLNVVDLFIPQGNKPQKYAFVEFRDLDQARQAISLSGQDFNGSGISISFAKPRNRDSQQSNSSGETKILFVKNLDPSTTQNVLEDHFGNVQEVRMMNNHDGSFRGMAFVEFYSPNDAKAAKAQLQGSTINGSRIEIDFAQPRGQKNTRGHGGSFRGGFKNRRGGQFSHGGHSRGNFNSNRGGNRYFEQGGNRGRQGNFRGNASHSRGSRIQFDED